MGIRKRSILYPPITRNYNLVNPKFRIQINITELSAGNEANRIEEIKIVNEKIYVAIDQVGIYVAEL